jgi:adenylyltransferase/sulfurtransferase
MPRQIDVRTLHERLQRGAPTHLLDVRQPWEHETAALPGDQLIPLDQLAARLDEIAPPDGALVVAYCHHGVRSLHAAALLEQAGLDVVSLAGGIDAWSLAIDPGVPRY